MRTRRRASVAIEAVMILPVVLAIILLTRFILESSLNRQEVAVYVRGTTVAAGAAKSISSNACKFDATPFSGRSQADQSVTQTCNWRTAENGLSDPFWDAVSDGASAWRGIISDVEPRSPLQDVRAEATGTATFTRTDFLNGAGAQTNKQVYLSPQNVLWTHSETNFDTAHNDAIWQELNPQKTGRLFPNVFSGP